jgi:phytoene dehydrogenase-like protein
MSQTSSHYDAIVIGAGMSGLSAGIRLSMFDKKVLILEKHTIPGGLNSYYQRRNVERGGVRQFDVGLHALTNFIKKGEKGKPFSKLLKQLRLSYDDFKLCPQTYSKISFPHLELKFSNDFELLRTEIHEKFPSQVDAFEGLLKEILTFNELSLSLGHQSAKKVLRTHLSDELLLEMLLCPLLIYGSAWEDDMDWAQFVIMFKSLYLEGFSRPEGGVRRIIELLMTKLKSSGGEIRFKAGVEKILTREGRALGVVVGEEEIFAPIIFSSIGYPETLELSSELKSSISPEVGKMTFLESIFILDKKIPLDKNDSTIIFYNNSSHYAYRPAQDFFDPSSAVVCFPDNYEPSNTQGEGVVRVTYIANYHQWKSLERPEYLEKKLQAAESAYGLVKKLIPGCESQVVFKDIFTPLTIERYTWHLKGTVYGSTDKTRDGRTPIEGLYIIGTDQGFLGIVGAILSGISMANLHGLMQGRD